MQPRVSIIILNWNGWQDTIECLESLFKINYHNYDIIIVDNNSQDDSIVKIREYCHGTLEVKSPFFEYSKENKPINIFELTGKESENPESELIHSINIAENFRRVVLLKNSDNLGFAAGNNVGISFALNYLKTDYIFLLNNDTVVHHSFLTRLVEVVEKNPEIGILGPKIYYYDFEGRKDVPSNLGGVVDLKNYPGYYDLVDLDNNPQVEGVVIDCDWVSGAALLMNSNKIPIKFLNSEFFFGSEDIDLAMKIKSQGFRVVCVRDSFIWHKESASRKKINLIGRTFSEIKSYLKFLKAHQKHYYYYLPKYILQILKINLELLFRKLKRDLIGVKT